MPPILVFVTTPSRSEARKIASKLLKGRLIACANIYGPVESRFWWQGKVEQANEFIMLMKSNPKLFAKVSKTVKEMHSYQVPEILAVPIVQGFQPYLRWLDATLADAGES